MKLAQNRGERKIGVLKKKYVLHTTGGRPVELLAYECCVG